MKKQKKIYKIFKHIEISILCGYAIIFFISRGFIVFNQKRLLVAIICWIISFLVFVFWIYKIIKLYKNKMENLHGMVYLKNLDLKDGKIKYIEPNGENVLEIKYKNYYIIKVTYLNNIYHTKIENEMWQTVKEFSSNNRTELNKILVKAAEFAALQI